MDIATLTQKMSEKAGSAPALDRTVKFDFGDEGVIFVDGYNNNAVSNENGDADCTVVVTIADFVDMYKGDLNPMNAFMGGKLKVLGDMSVAMKLQSLLG